LIERRGNDEDLGDCGHAHDEILVFPELTFGAVATDPFEDAPVKQHRTVSKGNERSPAFEPPDFGPADDTPAAIDHLEQAPDHPRLGSVAEQLQLAGQAVR